MHVSVVQIVFHPRLSFDDVLLFIFETFSVETSVEISSAFVGEFAEVLVCNVALMISIKILKDHINFIDLIFNSKMVQTLLKFIKTNSIIKIDIEITICIRDSTELFLNFDPKQVEHSVKDSTLMFWNMGSSTFGVGRENIVEIAGVIVGMRLLHW
tara:strand:- start:1747 stop:2214 length:468 start_codon:yes stop_codon:yes gene_type:complete